MRLDSRGLPLIPQPTDSPLDPLNYPDWLKYAILIQVSLLALVSTLNVTIINPAIASLAREFNISPLTATYQTATAIAFTALGPLFFVPLADLYGRRFIYLCSALLGLVSAVGSAKAQTYTQLLCVRAVNGFGPAVATVLGAGIVSDVFYVHQRGKAMGFFTLMLTNGAHTAPIIGGYIARDLGWRWCFWIGAIANAIIICVCFFLLPETLFVRPTKGLTIAATMETKSSKPDPSSSTTIPANFQAYVPPPMQMSTYLRSLKLFDRERMQKGRSIRVKDFWMRPFGMLRYPSVAAPVCYYAISYGLASVGPSTAVPAVFAEVYHFDSVHIGLSVGISLLTGANLGELCSGPVTDFMVYRARRRALEKGESIDAEIRLQGIWTGAIIVPIGLLIYGFTLQYADTFIAPCIGMAVACFGVQIITSVCFTYSCSDCYPHRSNDVSQCLSFFRQLFGFSLSFFTVPLANKIGFQWSNVVFAGLVIITFVPVVMLMWNGAKWRERVGMPGY